MKLLRKYTEEQYEYAELLLTHGFSVRDVARITRMSFETVAKLSAGDVMQPLPMHLSDAWEHDEKDE